MKRRVFDMKNRIDNIYMPIDIEPNKNFSVKVRSENDQQWQELFVYNVRVGHQQTPYVNSGMVKLDFEGTVEISIDYNVSDIASYEIRPTSYHISGKQEERNIKFKLYQEGENSKKLVVRINDNWETACLHILSNPIEEEKPDKYAENIHLIKAGDEIPFYLPEGKDTYYFERGTHVLPRGLWMEHDLKKVYTIDRFLIEQSPIVLLGYANGFSYEMPQKYIVEGKETEEEHYKILFDGRDNTTLGMIEEKITPIDARYVRLRLLGSIGDRFIYSNAIKQFRVYKENSQEDLTAQAETRAATPSMLNGKGISETGYSNWHAAESFFLCQDHYKVYLANGSIVKGAFASDEINHIKIHGRGILDCTELEHSFKVGSEDRTGAIWLISGINLEVEGITVLDPPMWSIVLNNGENIKVRNVNLIASALNADGIHFSSSSNVEMENCFIRTCDDLVVLYHYGKAQNITVKNCVLWSDDGHAFLFGLGSVKDAPIKNIKVYQCDIIDHRAAWDFIKYSGAIKLWPNGGNLMESVVFDTINIDSFQLPEKASVFKLTTHERLENEGHGILKNVLLKDIYYWGSGEQNALIHGVNEAFHIENVKIQNYCRNGVRVKDTNDGHITVSGYINGLTIE
jgi:hypothetical protein